LKWWAEKDKGSFDSLVPSFVTHPENGILEVAVASLSIDSMT